MTHTEIRKKFLDFFQSKGHTIVPSSSLLPDDPSVLFTTAGMQQFKKYYTGEADAMKDFGSLSTTSIQKSMRTSDIDEVGDERHLTFFEMLGNFSFGGYFKKEAITYAYEFVTKEMNLKIDYVTVFEGDHEFKEDTESAKIWKSLDPNIQIKKFGRADNFWGPTGEAGPCGPTTEIYVNGIEIWNIVFNEFLAANIKKAYSETKTFTLGSRSISVPPRLTGLFVDISNTMPIQIDTGMGLERLAMVVQGKANIFETDLFAYAKGMPFVIADHTRAIAFLITDGVTPSNKEQGYVLRRLMRRIIVHKEVDFVNLFTDLQKIYPEINLALTLKVFKAEQEKFSKTLDAGLRELNKNTNIDSSEAFKLFESYGLPFEVIHDIVPTINREEFDEEFKKHQERSREGSVRKFGGHGLLLDNGEIKAVDEKELEICTKLHTATHLLQASLRAVLGDEVHQDGSDITAERLRFDFTFSRKLTNEELKKVEDLVNKEIDENLKVWHEDMSYDEAIKSGALYFKKVKYPEVVKVYLMGKNDKEVFSKEFCGGPHVENTNKLGKFKIIKEESVSAGTRRIRAIVS